MNAVRVLLVDDNAMFRQRAAQFLEAHDEIVVVGAVQEAEEALARIDELRPDMVLIDLAMPGLSGLEAIPRLRAARPEAGIITLTLFAAEVYRAAALAAGADAFVVKATLATTLLPAIRRVMATRRPRAASQDP